MVALKLKLPYLAIIKISRDRLLNEENVVRQVFGFGAAVGKCGAAKPVRTRHGGQANKLQLPSGWHKIQSTPKKNQGPKIQLLAEHFEVSVAAFEIKPLDGND